MTDSAVPPHLTVEADLSALTEYRAATEFFCGDACLPLMSELGDLLAHRTGWTYAVDGMGSLLWTLGAFGGSGLNISITEDLRYHCFDYHADTDNDYASISDVEEWVISREEASLEKQKAGPRELASADDWKIFKLMDYDLRVDWSDGHYTATVKGIPMDATFAPTLSGVIRAGRELITAWFDAPPALAEDLNNSTVKLSARAAAQFASEGAAD